MRGHEPVNILLVDDQPAKLLSYEVILSELGENLIKAGSAREGLEQLLKRDIAILLVDVCMPDLDGFELAAMIREHPRYQNTAIIFVSAVHLTDGDRLRGYKSGAVDYIPVPVVPELLRAKVKVFAELYRKTRQLEHLNAELEQRVAGRTAELTASMERLSESATQFRAVFNQQFQFMALLSPEGRVIEINDLPIRATGVPREAVLGRLFWDTPWCDRLPEMRGVWPGRLAAAARTGGPVLSEDQYVAQGEVRTADCTLTAVKAAEGQVKFFIFEASDITERKRAEEHIHRIMKELSHRTKNLMAVVQAISWQTAQKSRDLEDFEQRFTQRIEALACSHDLLVKQDWRGVVIEDLVRAQLEPFLDRAKERLVAHGPTLLLMPAAAQDLGLALHELSTNASKYGALSVPTGSIEIGWTIAGGPADAKRFQMTWRESGGPLVSPPVHKGFGTTVITGTVSRTFNGKAELAYRPEGVSWALTAPIGHLITEPPE
jgi:PAS domain S-box-containing protein